MINKRFIVETVKIIDCDTDKSRIIKVITDTNELYSYDDLYELCDDLNNLAEENIQLKQEIKQYWKCRDKWKQETKELKEENEQLRQTVNSQQLTITNKQSIIKELFEQKGFCEEMAQNLKEKNEQGMIKMSEKRFVIGDDNIAMFEIIDMEKEELVCECRAVDVEKVVDLLNELSTNCSQLQEENEQLRQKLDFYFLDEFEWKEKYGD